MKASQNGRAAVDSANRICSYGIRGKKMFAQIPPLLLRARGFLFAVFIEIHGTLKSFFSPHCLPYIGKQFAFA